MSSFGFDSCCAGVRTAARLGRFLRSALLVTRHPRRGERRAAVERGEERRGEGGRRRRRRGRRGGGGGGGGGGQRRDEIRTGCVSAARQTATTRGLVREARINAVDLSRARQRWRRQEEVHGRINPPGGCGPLLIPPPQPPPPPPCGNKYAWCRLVM